MLSQEKAAEIVATMADGGELVTAPVTKPPFVMTSLMNIPFFSSIFKEIIGSTVTIEHVVTHPNKEILDTLPVIGMAFNSLDIVRIPMLYFVSYILGEKIPFTLGNNAKFVYGAIFLGMMLTSILLPFTAPIIGVCAAALVLTAGLAALNMAVKQQTKNREKLAALPDEMTTCATTQQELQTSAHELKTKLSESSNLAETTQIIEDISALAVKYEETEKTLKTLHVQQSTLEQSRDNMKVIDKRIKTSFALLGLAGSILVLAAPAAAPAMLMSLGLAGSAYFIGRSGLRLRNWLLKPVGNKDNEQVLPQETDSTCLMANQLKSGSSVTPTATPTKSATNISPPPEKHEPKAHITAAEIREALKATRIEETDTDNKKNTL